MATIPVVMKDVGPSGDGSTIRLIWTPVTSADTCAPVYFPAHNDKSIQAIGTFDSATVALHGSNDGGTTYAALRSPDSVAIGLTAAGIRAVLENTEWIKPVLSGGGGSQSLSVAMTVRMGNPLRQ